jgi:DeoR family glycerol-3-phosphate regulon repressor
MKIVTNSLEVAGILAPRADMEVVVAGGHVQRHNGGVVGASAVEFVSRYKCDFMVTGIGAIDVDGTLLEFHETEVAVAQAMLANARRVLVAADHSKFKRTANYRLCSLKDIDALYTDATPDRTTSARARTSGARIVVAGAAAR